MPHPTDQSAGSITLTESADMTTAHLRGEIDASLREQASSALAHALDRELPIVLDTSEVTFIDSSGIAFLIQLCTIGRDEGLPVTLVDPPTVVAEVLEMLGLAELFSARGNPPVTDRATQPVATRRHGLPPTPSS